MAIVRLKVPAILVRVHQALPELVVKLGIFVNQIQYNPESFLLFRDFILYT